jgi:CobQ-like glutamine amidotransferase family enzyme
MLHICGVTKTLGEWYQKTNKTEDTNKINFIGLQNNHHPSQHTIGNVHKTSVNCQQRPL